jgi:hypothetical protein
MREPILLPTIADLHRQLAELVAGGFGDLPVQVVVVPDSTIQALARHAGATDDAKPAIMLEYSGGARPAVLIISADRLGQAPSPRTSVQ